MNAKVTKQVEEQQFFTVGSEVVSALVLETEGYPLTPHGAARYFADSAHPEFSMPADLERAHFYHMHLNLA